MGIQTKTKEVINSKEHGQSLVELAVILVFLLILLAGIIDLGRMIFTYLTMRDAVQEGAAYASIVYGLEDDGLTDPVDICPAIQARVINNLPLNQSFDPPVIDVSGSECLLYTTACSGDVVTISVSTDFDLTMPIISTFVGTTVPLTASITDTLLSPYCP
jgi:Flp pilus assembly protein TadG